MAAGVPPLDKQRFDSLYIQFCRNQNMNACSVVSIGDSRMVDLHQLHVRVLHEGGAQVVNLRDLWAIIGGRLGFIQLPRNDSEPARSGPGIAQQLQNIYDQCLQLFESAYILTVKNRHTGGSPQQPIHQMGTTPPAIGNNVTPGMSGDPTEVPPNTGQLPLSNQRIVVTALRFVLISAQDMRASRVPEHMIAFVECHRA
ncbi:hypothetical protein HD554DRAFT_2021859 [Boletus coccyginus]|nr:hypothetical protein HD554DRAFT_2021859 [Boletus coccyginus]